MGKKKMMKQPRFLLIALSLAMGEMGYAQQEQTTTPDSIFSEQELQGVVVKAASGTKSLYRINNTEIIGQSQLIRAACCNLGESFTTNPSVDVSYSDAATGARQIKLLGLSGTYVQMLTENIPNLRGASIPYALGYVPGPWMQSIQVSKGAASVKNGYESLTGQIDVEFLKPQGTDGVRGNLYLDSKLRQEANVDGSVHLNDRLSTSLLLHVENRQTDHDGNGDGFLDMPKLRQYNLMHRWAYVSSGFISQLAVRLLNDKRESGMSTHHHTSTVPAYKVYVQTNRYEAQWKNAILFQDDHNSNIALMLHGSWHDADNRFGHTLYDVTQKNGYAQLLFESDLTEQHNLAVGASVNHDYYKEWIESEAIAYPDRSRDAETTSGFYAQYTYKWGEKLTLMPGLRWDYSNRYGGFLTPRLHVKFTPVEALTLRASAGKGYRSPHALAENSPMLASGRTFYLSDDLKQEEVWNYGLSGSFNLSVAGKDLALNAEYYYTHFLNQLVINVDGSKGAHTVSFENLEGKSYSHTLQVDATYPFFEGFTATAAYRYNDVRTTYDNVLRRRPLTSRYKGLITLSYKTPLELWQFDLTGQLNGKGELYDHTEYPTYFQLQAQVTREFRHFSIYIGGENLTNYRMKSPVIHASDPWSPAFDATQVWGPTDGAMAYIGLRFKFERL
ncbi:MAG: TonB-dependent receptor plug domain-containing protein [Parabacteroides sp.]